MDPFIVLFNKETDMETLEGHLESLVAKTYLPLTFSRMCVPHNSLVVARFGLLPFYREMERDLAVVGAHLLNSHSQHSWIANLSGWGGPLGVLRGLTPRTWTSHWHLLPQGSSFVVKGRTNSKKQSWNTRMFAKTKEDVPLVAQRLMEDDAIYDQGIVVREYVPLKKLSEGLNGLPITNEWRTFWIVRSGTPILLGSGFYWAASHPEATEAAELTEEGLRIAKKAAELVSPEANFFVIDVAETQEGDWIVIEVNDAQMSGLCGVPANTLYENLAKVLRM